MNTFKDVLHQDDVRKDLRAFGLCYLAVICALLLYFVVNFCWISEPGFSPLKFFRAAPPGPGPESMVRPPRGPGP